MANMETQKLNPTLVDKSNVEDFLKSFDTFLTDCDGKFSIYYFIFII